jgi:hypothetical protein
MLGVPRTHPLSRCRYELVGAGEPAELVVLSNSINFETFKVGWDFALSLTAFQAEEGVSRRGLELWLPWEG